MPDVIISTVSGMVRTGAVGLVVLLSLAWAAAQRLDVNSSVPGAIVFAKVWRGRVFPFLGVVRGASLVPGAIRGNAGSNGTLV